MSEKLTSSELATSWIVFQKKTMMLRVMESFLSHHQDPESKEILQTFYEQESAFVQGLRTLFTQEGIAVPVGFTENDVNLTSPRLFDDLFEVVYLRTMMKVATGIHALHLPMTYRQDMISLYEQYSALAEEYYRKTTQFLLSKGVLVKPPGVTLPEHVEFAEDKNYRSGFKLSGHRRSLNTVEVAYLYQGIETNIEGMKLMMGFAQVAKDKDVQNYFIQGKELSKTILTKLNAILLDSDITAPSPSAGEVTDSTTPPLSDKLMMYNTSLLSSFGLGRNVLGTSFSLRKDLPVKLSTIAKDIYSFASNGGNIMIKHGWMEEPPQMEDRTRLSKR